MKTLTFLALLLLTVNSWSMTQIPLKVEDAYIPPQGFDSNDHIEVVITGRLPGLCSELSDAIVEYDKYTSTFTITQKMISRNFLNCDQSANVLRPAFQKTISLGRLSEGKYKLKVFGNQAILKVFEVEAATQGQSIDENIYAPITSVFINDYISNNNTARFIIGGALEKSCLSFNPNDIEIIYHNDVVVVLPKLKIQGSECASQKKQLQSVVTLKDLPIGKYLLHVRTLSGGSINKVFEISNLVPQNH